MDMDFTPVNLRERQAFYTLWAHTPRHSLDYTLANLWGWQRHYGLEWYFDDSLCWIRQTQPEIVYWAPLGDWNKAAWAHILPNYFPAQAASFIRVPEELAQLWQEALPGHVAVMEDRDQWEYLYRQSDLAQLPGNRYHKKKNHYNSFVKTYGEPDYHELDDSMVEDVLAVQDDWCQWHECEDSPSLKAENEAINRVLSHWDMFEGLSGGSLYVEGRMVAFSVGERLDEQTLGVHYEKGLNGFRGVYQAINRIFAQREGADLDLVNRAQDLGEEGLRQAKQGYLPVDFVRKCKVTVTI
ncbi:MAG: phosphatidylglycerol lysyltransferase domain-containing protein [Desulfovibrionaceae bacterium]|nr:phosphatidylglycerol lysyltransferase domain-containing protein [Desulfovibrionaceae bacterium]